MAIPALWLDIGIHVAVKAKKLVVLVASQTGIKTLFQLAAIGSNKNAISLTHR